MEYRCSGREGQALMLVTAAIAAGIGEGKSIDDLSVLAAFFTLIGDQLALLAATRSRCSNTLSCACEEDNGREIS